jgi:DNA recombination protein RmuC
VFFYCRAKLRKERIDFERERDRLLSTLEESERERRYLSEELGRERVRNATLQARTELISELNERVSEKEEYIERLRRENIVLEKRVSQMQTVLEEERLYNAKRVEELENAQELMKSQFETLAKSVLRDNSENFMKISRNGVENLIEPFRMEMRLFRERLEQVHGEGSRDISALMNELRSLKELNSALSKEAAELGRALKGGSKSQGIWGETVLERVLELSGLSKGEEYEREVRLSDGAGNIYRPDAIVHLPGGRDVVIDAKTSLSAYVEYVNAEDSETAEKFARMHLKSMQRHIAQLSAKKYENLEGVRSLDFILMFIPIEGALSLAMKLEPELYEKAFSKKIVLVSSSSLIATLRAVENSWRYEKQSANAIEIARRAGMLYDKFVSFIEDMRKIGRQIETLDAKYSAAFSRLTEGRGNIVMQIERLRELGARASRELPQELISDDETE